MAEFARGKLDSVLLRALELSDDERERFLDETCERDTDLRRAVQRMLEDCEAEDLLLQPGAGASGPLWEALARDYSTAAFVFEPGERVGAYRVVRVLGRGGMATVYLAERADGQFEQAVALKVLDIARDFDALAARFAQERRILARLEHPNIARLIDGGATRTGQPYVVMEYVDGEPIDRYCDRLRLDIEERIRLFADVASAVQYAHGHLIVHRDIKPSNILVSADGEPKLLDFGIAKLLDAENAAPVTRSALHPMTPEFASPEQVRGELLTTASDVYQLGYLLYHLLTGGSPYATDRRNVAAIIQAICSVEPARPSSSILTRTVGEADAARDAATARATTPERLRRRLSGDLDNILLTALRKDPGRRYPSVVHLSEDLRRHLAGLPVTARSPTLGYRGLKFAGRHRAGVAGALLVSLAVIGGLAATAWQARQTAREAMRAAEVRDFLVSLFESVGPDKTLGETVTAKEILDRGAERLDSGLAEIPVLRAEMLGVVGRMYTELGLYREARPLLEEAQATLHSAGQQNTTVLAQSAEDLATVFYEQGEYEAAERASREALAIRRQRYREEPGELSMSLLKLGAVLNMRGQAEEAEPLYLEGLDIDRQTGNEELLASHLSDYGVFLFKSTRYDEALPVGEEALRLQRKLYGAEHTLVATSLLNLSAAHVEVGDYETAEKLLRECLAMRRKLLGDQHPYVATALNNLGHLLQKAGRLDEAEDAHRQSLAIRRTALGDSHPEVANTLNSLGIVQYFGARYNEAAETFEQVLPIWRESYGATHPNVLSALNNLGASRREAGDFAAAEDVLRETLALRREVFGESHQAVAQSFNNLALVLAKQGKNAEAETLIRDAVAMWRLTMGDEHPDVGDGLQSLGGFLLDQGRCPEAEPLFRESLAIRERVLDPAAPLLASVRLYLGECLAKLGRSAEAELLLVESLPVLIDRWGADAEITQRAEKALADTRRALNATER
jgi:serine/threonine-protein kinase